MFFGMGPLPLAEDRLASREAPGVVNRLWHFVKPCLDAGETALVVTISPEAPELDAPAEPRLVRTHAAWDNARLRELTVGVETAKRPELLVPLVETFDPDALCAAGSLLPGTLACAVAGERAVWADFMGDPLAEIGAKAQAIGDRFSTDEFVDVWRRQLRVLRRADAFSTVSRRQADALLGMLLLLGRGDPAAGSPLADRIHYVPCAVDSLDDLLDEAADPAAARAALGVPPQAPVVLWSGGFNAWSDPRTLIDGVDMLLARDREVRFVATGGPLPGYLAAPWESLLRESKNARHADRIHVPGWLPREQADAWLRSATVAVLTDLPLSETHLGGRNRLLYHAAAGCPIAASRGSEIVADMEAAGALAGFETGSAKDCYGALRALLRDPDAARELGRRGREFCARHYEFSTTAAPFVAFDGLRLRPPPHEGIEAAARFVDAFMDDDARERDAMELRRRRAGLKGIFDPRLRDR